VCCGVKRGLGEVEQAGETDYEAVDFAEGGEAEDFGGVVAARKSAYCNLGVRGTQDLRYGCVVEWAV
jgi:hypothetical protein